MSFGKKKVAVFVNGCFWHRCPRCKLPLPKSHTEWWKRKFDLNRQRDKAKIALLKAAGWRVLTLWECEIRDGPSEAAHRVAQLLVTPMRSRGPSRGAALAVRHETP